MGPFQQIVENSNLRLFVPLFFGKDIKTMQREVIVAIDGVTEVEILEQ